MKALLLFLFLFGAGHGWEAGGNPASAAPAVPFSRGAAGPVLAPGAATHFGAEGFTLIADSLPDPRSFGAVGWLVVGIVGLIGFYGVVMAAIAGTFAVLDRVKGKSKNEPQELKQPIIVKASQDGPDRIEFNMHVSGMEELKVQRKTDVDELKRLIGDVSSDLRKFSSDNYKRRRAMHRDINQQREAIAFMAGQMSARGDATGSARVRDLIRTRDEEDSE